MFELAYGKKLVSFSLPSEIVPQVITPAVINSAPDQLAEVETALITPLDVDWSVLKTVKTIAIAINDKTRPVPHKILLPPLLELFESYGMLRDQVRFYIATGTHLPMPPNEFDQVLPREIIENHYIESHDCDDASNLEFLGTTSAGTPVYVNRRYYQSDFKVVIGNIEPHHFMGFSGGNKSASIGLTGRETINRNHSMLLDDRSSLGRYDDNPMRQDVENIGCMIGVNLALNAILNDHKQIVRVIAGDPLSVIKSGVKLARELCQVPVKGKFDLVIASAGGHPKDINLYQAQKALTNAALLTRDGGTVILVTACPEGVGSQGYVDFMQGIHTFQEAIEKFKLQEFRVGPHKAYQFAKIGSRIKIVLKSEIPDQLVSALLLHPAGNLQACIDLEIAAMGGNPHIAILPGATNTLPLFI